MRFDTVIRGGRIVTASGIVEADLAIADGLIAALGQIADEGSEEINARGLHLFPGVIDTQVHFREPGMEHKEDLESGTRSAILGGVTTIFEMPNTKPTTTDREALADKLRRAEGRAWCDHAFFVGASTENIDALDDLEMQPGTPGVKVFHGSSTGSLLVAAEEDLRRVFKHGRRRTPIHSEDEARNRERSQTLRPDDVRQHPVVRDAESARMATERVLRLSKETGRPVHILHVSTREEIPMLERAKVEGLGTTCEITPQHLWFSAEDYGRLGTLLQMNPPVRGPEHRQALRDALRAGLFDVVGSDHAPHTLEEKAMPYPQSPSGIPGVQTLMQVMLTLAIRDELILLEDLARLTSEGPARIYGIANKGKIEPGMDADLALFDLNRTEVFERSRVASKCGWSPYEGETLQAAPHFVLLRGNVMVREGAMVGKPLGKPVRFDWK